MKNKTISTILLYCLIGVWLVSAQTFKPGDGNKKNGLEFFKIQDKTPNDGFYFKLEFTVTKSTLERNIIQFTSKGGTFMSINLKGNTLVFERPVTYNGKTKMMMFESWNKDIFANDLFTTTTKEKVVTLEGGFSKGSMKIYVYGKDFDHAACEWWFWGLSSGDLFQSGVKSFMDRGGLQVGAINPFSTFGNKLVKLVFDAGHNKNPRSCYTLNSNYNRNNVADPLTGLTKNNKNNCDGLRFGSTSKSVSSIKAYDEDLEDFENEDDFIIYPTPTKDILTLDFPKTWLNSKVEFSIVSPTGQLILNGYNIVSNGKEEIDVSLISPGIYFLVAKHNGRRHVKRLLIE